MTKQGKIQHWKGPNHACNPNGSKFQKTMYMCSKGLIRATVKTNPLNNKTDSVCWVVSQQAVMLDHPHPNTTYSTIFNYLNDEDTRNLC